MPTKSVTHSSDEVFRWQDLDEAISGEPSWIYRRRERFCDSCDENHPAKLREACEYDIYAFSIGEGMVYDVTTDLHVELEAWLNTEGLRHLMEDLEDRFDLLDLDFQLYAPRCDKYGLAMTYLDFSMSDFDRIIELIEHMEYVQENHPRIWELYVESEYEMLGWWERCSDHSRHSYGSRSWTMHYTIALSSSPDSGWCREGCPGIYSNGMHRNEDCVGERHIVAPVQAIENSTPLFARRRATLKGI